jgi:hypothetical protein
MSHDQNFKNLVLDYPREALAFFAEAEARHLAPEVRITPVREEQLKERLGERFRELDIPLLVEWLDGRRGALVFVIEEESDPRRFSVSRLAHYEREYREEAQTMKSFSERFREEGIQQGMQLGEATALMRVMRRKFGEVPVPTRQRIESADSETLLAWLDRIVTADSIEDVIH